MGVSWESVWVYGRLTLHPLHNGDSREKMNSWHVRAEHLYRRVRQAHGSKCQGCTRSVPPTPKKSLVTNEM